MKKPEPLTREDREALEKEREYLAAWTAWLARYFRRAHERLKREASA